MNNTFTQDGFVATEPFETTEVQVEMRSGFAWTAQANALTPLKAIFGAKGFDEDLEVVYVKASDCKAPWAKNVYEANGKKFILVPKANVVLFTKQTEES